MYCSWVISKNPEFRQDETFGVNLGSGWSLEIDPSDRPTFTLLPSGLWTVHGEPVHGEPSALEFHQFVPAEGGVVGYTTDRGISPHPEGFQKYTNFFILVNKKSIETQILGIVENLFS